MFSCAGTLSRNKPTSASVDLGVSPRTVIIQYNKSLQRKAIIMDRKSLETPAWLSQFRFVFVLNRFRRLRLMYVQICHVPRGTLYAHPP
jgi:hypothetical protein